MLEATSRPVISSLAVLCFFVAMQATPAQEPTAFSFQELQARARALAAKDYHPETQPELPEYLKKLSYDDYQRIRFLPDRGPWQAEGLKFGVQFFHRGFIYQDPVRIHLVEQGRVRDFAFSPQQFEYGSNHFPTPVPPDLQFAGLRVLYPLNSPAKQDEVAAFLGASYFRVIGAEQVYGASFRGLAIDTAEPSGEEFPRFTDFWLEKPAPGDNSARLYALLDSPSVAGAYQFVIRPGGTTQVEVEARLFFRKPVKKLGVAPVTSMFLVGKNRTRFVPDFRPEVHDSDGLVLQTNAQSSVWRPLINPEKEHVISRFSASALTGFGLLQRDHQFDHYQDLAGRYERRPSLWVQPRQDWGTGTVELVEIPSANEWNDNVVSYWVPGQNPEPGQGLQLSYTLSAGLGAPERCEMLRVEATRITPPHDKNPPRFVIDFSGNPPQGAGGGAPIEAAVQTSSGKIQNLVTQTNELTGGWRAFFDLVGASDKGSELNLFLHRHGQPVSETWLYHYE